MEEILLRNIVPEIFSRQDCWTSEIWHKEMTFCSGKKYLIEAVSGAGKSSLCSYIYGYRRDYLGEIAFDGQNIRHFDKKHWGILRKDSLSILFQELRLFGELTVWENIQIKNRLTGFKTPEWIMESLERLGIGDKKEQLAGKLSFGQQQRVACIRALCQPFRFILLDEPVSHLDEANNRAVGALLAEETARQDAAVIVTSIGRKLDVQYDKILHL